MKANSVLIHENSRFTKEFNKIAGERERAEMYSYLEANPKAGDVIRASGGIRKLRWSRPAMGKRGGMRIIYYYFDKHGFISLLLVYAKNEKEDLGSHEIKKLRQVVAEIEYSLEGGDDD